MAGALMLASGLSFMVVKQMPQIAAAAAAAGDAKPGMYEKVFVDCWGIPPGLDLQLVLLQCALLCFPGLCIHSCLATVKALHFVWYNCRTPIHLVKAAACSAAPQHTFLSELNLLRFGLLDPDCSLLRMFLQEVVSISWQKTWQYAWLVW